MPIYESDEGRNRWEEDEWRYHELWKKEEEKKKRKNKNLFIAACCLFICFTTVLVTINRFPKWETQYLARKIAQTINQLQTQALLQKSVFRIVFINPIELEYVILKQKSCEDEVSIQEDSILLKGKIDSFLKNKSVVMLGEEHQEFLSLNGLVRSYCFDPFRQNNQNFVFALIPEKDLIEKIIDRVSIVQIQSRINQVLFK